MICLMHCGNQADYFPTFRDLAPYEKESKSNINPCGERVSLKHECHGSEILEAMQVQMEGWIKNGNTNTYIDM